jgi:hypothetical protein
MLQVGSFTTTTIFHNTLHKYDIGGNPKEHQAHAWEFQRRNATF